jgi:hypothetical protein
MTLPAKRQAQFIRCSRVDVRPAEGGKIWLENLTGERAIRVTFEVVRSWDPTGNTPNDATIRLYNLASDTRKRLEGLPGIRAPVPAAWSKAALLASDAERGFTGPDAIVAPGPEPVPGDELPPVAVDASHKFGYAHVYLSAGYGGKVGQIFEGTMIVPMSRKPDSVTWETTLVVGDGTLGASKAVSNLSFPAGTDMLTVIRHLVLLLGVGFGNLTELSWARILAAGQRMAGKPFSTSSALGWPYSPAGSSAWRDLALFLELSNVKWVIDQGQFYLLEPDGFVIGQPVDMGRPLQEIENLGAGLFRGLFLLNNLARPAGRITIDSKKFPSTYVARTVRFSGDTHGGGFTTSVDFSGIDPLGLGIGL